MPNVTGLKDSNPYCAVGLELLHETKYNKKMSDFIARLSDEKSQLDEKIAKLEAFTKSDAFNGIDNVQRGLLKIQLNAMATYSQVLDERLWRLSPSESVD